MAMFRDRREARDVFGERLLHPDEGSADFSGNVVLVDDGLETGATLYAATLEPKVALT